tara:strand:+ start:5439 stop:5789 length:351 start_codon:yes stop_codon:yes gene_type:complete
MANYAHIDPITNQVINMIVANEDYISHLPDRDEWISVSLDKKYAGVGATYYAEHDCFISPKPFPSWRFNLEELRWQAPISYPTGDGLYEWNEENFQWEQIITSVGIASTSNAQEIE